MANQDNQSFLERCAPGLEMLAAERMSNKDRVDLMHEIAEGEARSNEFFETASIAPSVPNPRKRYPLATGVLDYFPDALMEVAHVSYVGNEQHNPGEPLHWAKHKSTDEADALMRHLKDRGTLDTDGVRHSAKVAWRALALLQREIDAERAKSNE